MQFVFRPMSKWGRPETVNRKRSPFKQGRTNTDQMLTRELRKLHAEEPIVVEANFSESDIRNDGQPRADARQPRFPGVAISFTAMVGGRKTPLRFACDDCRDWQHNLRAIAMTLVRLREADIYGVTKSGEQYAGWKALPDASNGQMTVDAALAFFKGLLGPDIHCPNMGTDADAFQSVYRIAAKRFHPDANAGDNSTWLKMQDAKRVIYQHFAAQGA